MAVGPALPLENQRIDLASAAVRARLEPGRIDRIPQSSVDLGQEGAGRQAPREDGWTLQERAQRFAGSNWTAGRNDAWSRFSGGQRRGSSSGAVHIDGTRPTVQGLSANPPTAPKIEGKTGWDRLAVAHEMAALLEESQRDRAPTSGQRPNARSGRVRV